MLMDVVALARQFAPPTAIVLCWLWESLVPARLPKASRTRQNALHIAIGLSNSLLVAMSLGILMWAVGAWTAASSWGLLNQCSLPPYIRWPLVLLILDGCTYLWHFANHRSAWLWRFHRAHHSDRHLSATTAVRFHAGEIALSAAAKTALVPILGLRLEELAIYETLLAASTAFHHANISLGRWDRLLRLAIVTPAMHKLHHSIDPRETHSNFASILSLWDRCGGTFLGPKSMDPLEFGVEGLTGPDFQTFVGIWSTPVCRSPKLPNAKCAERS
jgi:sterol desaturase/sphingolipid hydroxylase (fatty acid hydroxylase superfamily)